MENADQEKRCIYHPQNQGAAFCKRCNGYICTDCIIEVDNKKGCRKCYADYQKLVNAAAVKKCINHPNNTGSSYCKKCGGYLCRECIIIKEGKQYCKKCLEEYLEAKTKHSDPHTKPRCVNHPDTESNIICERCNAPLCKSCVVMQDFKFYCAVCAYEINHVSSPNIQNIGIFSHSNRDDSYQSKENEIKQSANAGIESAESIDSLERKEPRLAYGMLFFIRGLGQIHCGKIAKGVIFMYTILALVVLLVLVLTSWSIRAASVRMQNKARNDAIQAIEETTLREKYLKEASKEIAEKNAADEIARPQKDLREDHYLEKALKELERTGPSRAAKKAAERAHIADSINAINAIKKEYKARISGYEYPSTYLSNELTQLGMTLKDRAVTFDKNFSIIQIATNYAYGKQTLQAYYRLSEETEEKQVLLTHAGLTPGVSADGLTQEYYHLFQGRFPLKRPSEIVSIRVETSDKKW